MSSTNGLCAAVQCIILAILILNCRTLYAIYNGRSNRRCRSHNHTFAFLAVSNIAFSIGHLLKATLTLIGVSNYFGVALTLKSMLLFSYLLNMSANLNLTYSRYCAARYPFKSYIDSANAIPKKRYCWISTVCLALGFVFGTIAEYYGRQQIVQILVSGCRILLSIVFLLIYWEIYTCLRRSRMKVQGLSVYHNKSQKNVTFLDEDDDDRAEEVTKEAREPAKKLPMNDDDEGKISQKKESVDEWSTVSINIEKNLNKNTENDTPPKVHGKVTKRGNCSKLKDDSIQKIKFSATSALTRTSGKSVQASAFDTDSSIDVMGTQFPNRNLSLREDESKHVKNERLVGGQHWDEVNRRDAIESRREYELQKQRSLKRRNGHGNKLHINQCNTSQDRRRDRRRLSPQSYSPRKQHFGTLSHRNAIQSKVESVLPRRFSVQSHSSRQQHLSIHHSDACQPRCAFVLAGQAFVVSQAGSVQTGQAASSQIDRSENERHLLKLSVGIISSFVVLNLPFSVCIFFFNVEVDCSANSLTSLVTMSLMLLNPVFDPLFYIYMENRRSRN